MRYILFSLLAAVLFGALLTGCAPSPPVAATPTLNSANLANPASEYCVQQGHKLEMRKDAQGNEYGVCIFEDGSECEEWAFFRGECGMDKENKLSLNVVEAAGLERTVRIDVLAPKTSAVDPDVSREPRKPGMEIIFSVTDPKDIKALVAPLDAKLPLVPPLRCPASYELQFHLENGDVQTFNLGLCGLYGPQKYWQGMTIRPPEAFISQFNALLDKAGVPHR
jgi:putative hemolysin